MKTPSQKIAAQIKSLGNEVMAIYKEHNDQPTGDALKSITEKREQMETLNTQYLEAEEAEKGKDAVKAHLDRLENPGKTGGDFAREPGRPQIKTLADIVMEDEAFKSWFVEKAKEGGPAGQFRSPSVQTVSLKTLVTGASDSSAGAFIRSDYDADVALPYRARNLRDLVTIATTGSDTIEYTQETARENNARVVPEARFLTDAAAAAPESGLTLEKKVAVVEDIETWIPATRNALSDAGQMRQLIEGELRGMVADRFEDYIVAKVLATPGILVQTFVTDKIVTGRKAQTKVEYTGLAQANGYLMNPQDWEDIQLMRDGEGRFYLGGPISAGAQTFWGQPVTRNVAIPQGLGLTGDLRTVKVYDREQTQIFTTDSHGDLFIKSISVLLCVARAAVAVKRPAALTQINWS